MTIELKPSHDLKSLRDVYKMDKDDAWEYIVSCTADNPGGMTPCPKCKSNVPNWISTRNTFKCSKCSNQYSPTSGTILSNSKMEYRDLIAAAFLFCSGLARVSSMNGSRNIGMQQKTIYVLFSKFREAIMRNGAYTFKDETTGDCVFRLLRLCLSPGKSSYAGVYWARPNRDETDNLPE